MESKHISYNKWILWIVVAGLVILLAYKVLIATSQNAKAFEEDLPSTHVMSTEYSSIISDLYKNNLKVTQVFKSKVRNPISTSVMSEKYNLTIYKIDLLNDLPLKDIINLEFRNVDRSVGFTYAIINKERFDFQYKAGEVGAISNIFLTMAGDSIRKVAQSDSVISYGLICDNLSVRYSKSDPIDIFVTSKFSGFSKLRFPANILFLKRGKAVYFMMLSIINNNESIPSDLLYNIVLSRNS